MPEARNSRLQCRFWSSSKRALQQHGHVLPPLRRPHQRLRDRVARPQPVQADAYLVDLRVLRCAIHEPLDRAVVVERVVERHVALVQQSERIGLEVGRFPGFDRLIPERHRVRPRWVLSDERVQVTVVEGRREPEGGLLGQVERLPHVHHPRKRPLDLQARRRPLRPVLDCLREVVPVDALHVEIGQTRKSHLVHRQVFWQEEVAAQAHERSQTHERPWPPRHRQQPRQRVGKAHQVVQRFTPRRQVERLARQARQRPRIEQIGPR